MMKRIIQYILLLAVMQTYGQELNLPVWTQYLADNDFVISPTYAGIGDNLKIRANGLTQWVGIKNAPDNQSIYADFRIANQSGSFGISYNINSFRIDIENFNNIYDTPILDPAVTDDRSVNNNNFDAGILYRWDNYWLSLNANNLVSKDTDPFVGLEPSRLLNYQIYSGYVIKPKKNKDVEFEPSVFFQLFDSDKRSSTDVNFKYRKFNRKGDYFWVGASYRFLNDQFFDPLNVGPMAGILQNNIYFAYSYQLTLNELSGFNSGTHVVTIGLNLLQNASNCPCTKGTSQSYYR